MTCRKCGINPPLRKRRVCRDCHNQWQRDRRGYRPLTLMERLAAHTVYEGPCALSTYGQCSGGYPEINVDGVMRRVHAVVWELEYGGPPGPGLEIDHCCPYRNNQEDKRCITHLEAVTHDENIRRGLAEKAMAR